MILFVGMRLNQIELVHYARSSKNTGDMVYWIKQASYILRTLEKHSPQLLSHIDIREHGILGFAENYSNLAGKLSFCLTAVGNVPLQAECRTGWVNGH
jgi:hypothetical protein